MVKNPPAMQEVWVPSLAWEDPLEKEMATHSRILAKIPWTEEPGRQQSTESKRVRHNLATKQQQTCLIFLKKDLPSDSCLIA